jgi:hypothetical protein
MNIRVVMPIALLLSLLAQGISAIEPSAPMQVAAPSSTRHQNSPIRFEGRNGIDSIQFVIDLPFTEHPVALSAETLRRWGCTYESHDPARTLSMERLLGASEITADAGSERRELRQLLAVNFKDGSTLKFDFGEVFPSDDVVRGHINGMPITARKELQTDLFKWALPIAAEAKPCRAFLERFK